MKWTADDLNKAQRAATANMHNLPDQTCGDRIHGKIKDDARVRSPTIWPPSKEQEIIQTCIIFAGMGHKRKIMKFVERYKVTGHR